MLPLLTPSSRVGNLQGNHGARPARSRANRNVAGQASVRPSAFTLKRLPVAAVGLAITLALAPAASAAERPGDGLPLAATQAERGSYRLNLYEDGDFVRQYTAYWCIGASMQM